MEGHRWNRQLRPPALHRFLTATGPSPTVPIPPYASSMDSSKFNAAMADMTPEEIRLIPRFVDTWLDAGWMDEDEADEWRRHCDAWQAFLGLDHQPPKTH